MTILTLLLFYPSECSASALEDGIHQSKTGHQDLLSEKNRTEEGLGVEV
jgi:hypothetical protein